ncbi:MAG: 2-amino-4-hydroxy-6-hydroxymethyldihydropteridine diphosphokinase [Opitutales bacterium]
MPLVRAYIALGSNLGNRLAQMQSAVERLSEERLKVCALSPVYENRAVGMGEDAAPFLNAIAEVETSLEPLALLDRCLEVERELGRVRTGEWAPRTIDLDIIVYGEEAISDERLQVPHPRIAERDFVVHPLNAIAPDLIIRGQAVSEMAATLSMDDLSLFPVKLILNARS